MEILIVPLLLFATVIAAFNRTIDPKDCSEHEWWNPSLHMSEKATRCRKCGTRQLPDKGE